MATAQATRSSTDPAAEAWGLLFELWSDQRQRLPRIAAELELAPRQAHLLRLLEPDRPLAMSRLACALRCDPSNVTGIVDRLEERGLIARRQAPGDRRVKMLVLTPEGESVREQVRERLMEPPAEIASLSKADQRALRDVLRRALSAAPRAGSE
jgi:DNA-binding MarR family transcriptional regulator